MSTRSIVLIVIVTLLVGFNPRASAAVTENCRTSTFQLGTFQTTTVTQVECQTRWSFADRLVGFNGAVHATVGVSPMDGKEVIEARTFFLGEPSVFPDTLQDTQGIANNFFRPPSGTFPNTNPVPSGNWFCAGLGNLFRLPGDGGPAVFIGPNRIDSGTFFLPQL